MTWKLIKLSEVLTQNTNKIPISPGEKYKQITVRMWGKGVILRRECDGSEIAARSQISPRAGDFIISKIDARHGAFGLVPQELAGGVVSNDFPCFTINQSKIEPRFLDWYSKTDSFVSLCKQASKGSTNRVRLKESQFLDLKIPLPTMKEQRKIALSLDKVQNILREREDRLNAIKQDTEAMLLNAFKEVVKDADYKDLSEVAPLVRRPVSVEIDGKYAELGVRSFGKGTFHKPTLSGVDVGNKRLFEIQENDLLFNIVFAWEGAIAVPTKQDHKRVGSHRFLTCVPDSKVATSKFLRYFLLSPEGLLQVGKASPGGAGRNRTLGIKKAAKIRVPIPELGIQEKFDCLYAHVESIRAIRAASKQDVDALIPAMLHNIFEQTKVVVTSESTIIENECNGPNLPTPIHNFESNGLREAALVGAIVKAFHTIDNQPMGNFRLQKAVYFARRYMGETALDQEYLKKAAGPYNPHMRYSGGIKIAIDRNWVRRAIGDFGEGNALGASVSEMDEWIEKYEFSPIASWVRNKFKYKQNNVWELLATVDYAKLAIEADGSIATSKAILDYIEDDEEWKPKIEKLGLTQNSITNVLVELDELFAN